MYFIEMAWLDHQLVNINYNHGDESRKKNNKNKNPQEQHQQRTVKTNIYLAFFCLKDRMSQSYKQ